MKTGVKIALLGGIAVVLGGIAYMVLKKPKSVIDESDVDVESDDEGYDDKEVLLSPREKYYHDIRHAKAGDALEWYRGKYATKYKSKYPNKADFWAWLWSQQKFGAYKSYNAKTGWMPDERVVSVK